jgi:hypothetical protein
MPKWNSRKNWKPKGRWKMRFSRVETQNRGERHRVKMELIEYLSDPRDTRTLKEFAREESVHYSIVLRLMEQKSVSDAVKGRLANHSITARAQMMKGLFRRTLDGNIAAIKLYNELTGEYTPTEKKIVESTISPALEKMSDDELNEEVDRRLKELRKVGEGKAWKPTREVAEA